MTRSVNLLSHISFGKGATQSAAQGKEKNAASRMSHKLECKMQDKRPNVTPEAQKKKLILFQRLQKVPQIMNSYISTGLDYFPFLPPKCSTHIVLDVRLAPRQQQDAAGLVVAVLACEVERREASFILDIYIGLGPHQRLRRVTVALPRCLV